MKTPPSKTKFSTLTEKRRHKILSRFLRVAIENHKLFDQYIELASYINLPPLPYDFKLLSDRYHYHCKIAEIRHSEQGLLQITSQDKASDIPFLPIDIFLEDLRSMHNVGSIIRTTEAFRLGVLHLSAKIPAPDHPSIKKSSMGCEEDVIIHQNADLDSIRRPIIALETSPDATPLEKFSFPSSFSLLFGNEEYGLSDRALSQADHLVSIPLYGNKNSLNVANCFAIVAHQVSRDLRSLQANGNVPASL